MRRAPGRSKAEVKIIGVPRSAVIGLLDALCVLLLFRRGALLTLAAALSTGKMPARIAPYTQFT